MILAVTRPAATLAPDDAPVDRGFDFDLLAVIGTAQIRERLATASADLGLVGQVDGFFTSGQMRVVSAAWSGTTGLLAAFVFRSRLLRRIVQLVRAIGSRLFFGLFAESFGLELTDLCFCLIEFGLQFYIPPDRIGMSALPITNLAPQLADLLPQFGILLSQRSIRCSQFSHFLPQLLHQRRQRLKLVVEAVGKLKRSIHSAPK